MFVMLIPGLVGSYFNSESLELFLGLLVGLAFFCYLALNLYWIFNEEVRGMFLVHISKIIFALLVVIGTIFTAGIGLLFTFPALVFIGYLLYWHSQKYKEYQDKIKKNEEDQEKIRKYNEYEKQIEEYERYQARLKEKSSREENNGAFISFNSWLFIDSWWVITSNLHSKFISFIKKIK